MKNPRLLILFFLVIACSKPNQNSPNADANEMLVKHYFDHFNSHDWVAMAEMYTDTAEFKDPSLGKEIVKQTRQQITKKYSELHDVFPDVRDSILTIYPAGEKHIVVEFVSRGTASDSSEFVLPICTIFTIENGLIAKDFTYYDNF
jgi:ketosteroid isomerase-like protein